MKSLTLFVAAAVFTCAVSAQHHGGYEHAGHDLDNDDGHDNYDSNHGDDQPVHDPIIQEQPNVEIRTRPPVIVLQTVTRTKPWVIMPKQKTILTTVKYNAPTFQRDHDNNYGSGHNRDHSNYDHPEDHSRDHGDSRQRQKGHFRQQIHANSISPKQRMDGHLAAAAVSSAGRIVISSADISHTAVRSAPSTKVIQAASPSVARSIASSAVAPSTNDANSLPVHSIFITVTAGMTAWLLLL